MTQLETAARMSTMILANLKFRPDCEQDGKRELADLTVQFNALAGSPHAAKEFLEAVAKSEIARLDAQQKTHKGNPRIFQKWIAKLQTDGITGPDAIDSLRAELVKLQAAKLKTFGVSGAPAAPAPARTAPTPSVPATIAQPATPSLTMTRDDWTKLRPSAQAQFFVDGGRLCEDLAEATPGVATRYASPTMTRSKFNTLPHAARNAFMRAGGSVFDSHTETTPAKPSASVLKSGKITRVQFNALSCDERNAYIRGGGKLVG